MNVSKVSAVKEINKNGRTMYLVTLEGKNYMCFDKKWKDLEGSTIKYEFVANDKGYTNVELKEIVSGPTGGELSGETPKQAVPTKPLDLSMSYTMSAANAFIQAGMIKDPDAWIAFLETATPLVKDFLERSTELEKTI